MPLSYNAAEEPPKKYSTHPPPPPPSLSSLADEIVLKCIAVVPRSYHRSLSCVSKHLRSLVLSPELNRLQSTLIPKNSLHLCLQEVDDEYDEDEDDDDSFFHWFTVKETSTTGYGLVLNPTPFPPHSYASSSTAVAVGSKMFFVGGSNEPSTDLWILDTRTGNITQGPSMSVSRENFDTKLSVWRRLVGRDGKQLPSFVLPQTVMAQHDGRLVVLWGENDVNDDTMNVHCMLVSLDRSGDRICGTVDWSGTVATVPYSFWFLHCLAVSD